MGRNPRGAKEAGGGFFIGGKEETFGLIEAKRKRGKSGGWLQSWAAYDDLLKRKRVRRGSDATAIRTDFSFRIEGTKSKEIALGVKAGKESRSMRFARRRVVGQKNSIPLIRVVGEKQRI